MKCKCKQIKEYWDAIGNSNNGYFTRSTLGYVFFIGTIPIIGQMLLIYWLIGTYIEARKSEEIPEKYKLKTIQKLTKKLK